MGLIAPIVVLPRWFPEKPGLAYGLALVGFGLGTMVNVPLISFLLSATGDPFRTFAVLGLSYAVLVGGAAWFGSSGTPLKMAGAQGASLRFPRPGTRSTGVGPRGAPTISAGP